MIQGRREGAQNLPAVVRILRSNRHKSGLHQYLGGYCAAPLV